jgi:Schlafen, AlbA_2
MEDLSELCKLEQSDSGLAFRDRLYARAELPLLVRDLIALANARVRGRRSLVIGVRDVVGGERTILGIDKLEMLTFRKSLPKVVARAIEPALQLYVRSALVDGKHVIVVTLENCDDPPYLVAHPLGNRLPVGTGFVRRGSQTLPLKRSDLKSMFLRAGDAPLPDTPLRLCFMQRREQLDEICLPIVPLAELPSERAAQRLRAMLESKQLSRDLLGRTETQLSRLMFARVYGAGIPFESHTDESLAQRLSQAEDDYRDADNYYCYELQAHKLQFALVNDCHRLHRNVKIKVDVQRTDGIGFADAVYREDGCDSETYPRIETTDKRFSIEVDMPKIRGRSMLPLFSTEPRFWARETARGKSVIVDVHIEADGLAAPIVDTLIMHLGASDAKA